MWFLLQARTSTTKSRKQQCDDDVPLKTVCSRQSAGLLLRSLTVDTPSLSFTQRTQRTVQSLVTEKVLNMSLVWIHDSHSIRYVVCQKQFVLRQYYLSTVSIDLER